ncbi:MAG: hypothetical protein U0441_07150 [Polyangiaceae bacterium]
MSPGITLELSFDSTLAKEQDAPALAERLLGALIRSLSLDAARGVPGALIEEPPSSSHVRAAWLTFLPLRMGPVPTLPQGFSCVTLEETGWLLRAIPRIPDPKESAYRDALAHLRHLLGARALLDGPAIAPPPNAPVAAPAPTPAVAPIVAPPAIVPPPEVPSYLKPSAPSISSKSPVSEPVSAPPAAARSVLGTPLTSETADIDISKLLRSSLPFDARKQGPTPPAARSSPPAAPPARSANGRWIRFNPQTGEPLTEPLWQELAAPERTPESPRTDAAPPARLSTGTVEVDPDLVARILAANPRK